MSKHFRMPAPRRGLIGAFADANPTALLEELKSTFAQMKAAMGERDQKDVVTQEKIDRINGEVSALQKALDDANKVIAAARIGAGTVDDRPEAGEHALAFNRYFKSGADAGLRDLEAKAELSTLADPDGGYLVPRKMETTIDQVLRDMSVMRQLAKITPIDAMEYRKFVNLGGGDGGWVGEKEARPETGTPELAEMLFTVMELYAMPVTTQRLLDSGAIIDVAAWLGDEVQEIFSAMEGQAFISGDGVKRPKGFMSYDKVANASWSWGKIGFTVSGAAGGFAVADAGTGVSPEDAFYDLIYALRPGHRRNAAFLMSDGTQARIRKLKDAEGKNIWAPPTSAETVASICGKPVYTDDFMPEVEADAYPIALADWKRAYNIFDVKGIRIMRDAITTKGKVKFYTTKYVGGGLNHYQPIKLMKIAAS